MQIAIPIFLTIGIYIESTRLLEVGFSNVKYYLKKRFYEEYTSADYGDEGEIIEAIAANDNKDNNEKNL